MGIHVVKPVQVHHLVLPLVIIHLLKVSFPRLNHALTFLSSDLRPSVLVSMSVYSLVWFAVSLDDISQVFVVFVHVFDNALTETSELNTVDSFHRHTSECHEGTEFSRHSALVERSSRVRNKSKADFVKGKRCMLGSHGVTSSGQKRISRV